MCGCNKMTRFPRSQQSTRYPGSGYPGGPGGCPPDNFNPNDPLNLGPLEPCAGGFGTWQNMPALGGMVLVACERPPTFGGNTGVMPPYGMGVNRAPGQTWNVGVQRATSRTWEL